MTNTPQSGEWGGAGYDTSGADVQPEPYSDTPTTGYGGTSATGSDLGGTSSGSGSTTDVAKGEAREVAGTASQAGQQVAQTAKDEAGNVVSEVGQQSKQLWQKTLSELSGQATGQQQRIAGGVRSVTDELRSMAQNSSQSGVASDLAHQVADRGQRVADWLENREPRDLLDEVRSFARRRPGAFLGLAAVSGLLIGRLTRGLASDARDQANAGSTGYTGTGGYTTGYARPDYQQSGYSGYQTGYTTGAAGYDTGTGYDTATAGQTSGVGSGSDMSLQEVPTAGTGGAGTSYDPVADQSGYADTGLTDPDRGDLNR